MLRVNDSPLSSILLVLAYWTLHVSSSTFFPVTRRRYERLVLNLTVVATECNRRTSGSLHCLWHGCALSKMESKFGNLKYIGLINYGFLPGQQRLTYLKHVWKALGMVRSILPLFDSTVLTNLVECFIIAEPLQSMPGEMISCVAYSHLELMIST